MTVVLQPDEQLRASHRVRAQLLRRVSNSTPLERTMRKAVRVLTEAGTPSLVVGGYAVQEHGYARFTSDVDITVRDVAAARAVLSINGFRENPGSTMSLSPPDFESRGRPAPRAAPSAPARLPSRSLVP